jgi:hypothetical protein
MQAIVHSRYGPPDALELNDIDQPGAGPPPSRERRGAADEHVLPRRTVATRIDERAECEPSRPGAAAWKVRPDRDDLRRTVPVANRCPHG